MTEKSMVGKTVLITGATNGIGLETALELARQGANIAFTARNRSKGEATLAQLRQINPNAKHEMHTGDLSVMADVRRIAQEFKSKHGTLDVLINNAGGTFDKRQTTSEGLEYTFALNHLSYFLLSNLLLETLKATPNARVINVSSSAQAQGKIKWDDPQYERAYNGMGAYFQSKLMNVLFSNALARRLQGSGVTVNALHPGVVNSGFGDNATTPLMRVAYWLIKRFGAISTSDGAKTSIYLASSAEVAGISGKYFEKQKVVANNPIANDLEAQERLWTLSAQITGLN
jgi:NAD(P)-dependent dehydrogenase (short-subunit alcohol dehydrogenase family)